MHIPLLQEMLVILGFSVVIVFLLQRIKLPSILGFIITGVIIGPYGLSLVKAVEEVEVISEIGVILLLFVIGMELSIKQLTSMKKTVFVGGFLQVGLTVIVAGAASYFLGLSLSEAVFVGFMFSLSSTAIVLKVFQDRNEISSPHGRSALGILIFQDIIVVPMMLLTPILAGETTNIGLSIISLLVKSIIVVALTIVSARYLVPKLLYAVTKTKSKELFLLTTITLCFAVAFLTSKAGLSLALGAFLAGLIISESDYSHQATSIILPFRELFSSFFFISIGMLLDLSFFIQNFWIIFLIVTVVFLVKGALVSLSLVILKYPPRTVLLTGLALFQVGEFAFILSKAGIQYGLLNEITNQYFLAVSVVSMLLTPFTIIFSEKITAFLIKTRIGAALDVHPSKEELKDSLNTDQLKNHLIIVGYGINGSNLAKAAKFSNIPFVIVELNAQTVRREKQKDIPILFGDATHEHILESVNLHHARAVVIAISDPMATKTIIKIIRAISQSVYILVRTRYVSEINDLLSLGADDVIPEEFETSVEIFSRVLQNFFVPVDDIEHFAETLRADNYNIFQARKKLPKVFNPTKIPDFNVSCVHINNDSGSIVGKSIEKSNIRGEFGINIIAIRRNDKMLFDIRPEEKLLQNDYVFLHGEPGKIDDFHHAVNS